MREWGLTPPQWRDLPDADRDLMVAESELVCQSCGGLKSVCSTSGLELYPQRDECMVAATRALVWRRLHKKYKQEPGTEEMHPLDGLGVWFSEVNLDPEDDFFDLPDARSRLAAADEPYGDVDTGP